MQNYEKNKFLNREKTVNDIKLLTHFKQKKNENTFKKGIYIYGPAGSGKTTFVMNLLHELNYDIIKYDTGDVRNKALIDTITKNNMSDRNVLSMMRGTQRKIAIVMDEIDGMNNGDKGGITALIKLIRQKKTKKQKLEDETVNPIICIGNYHTDKKIRELMKVCNTFELKRPTDEQIIDIFGTSVTPHVINLCQGDLRKIDFFIKNPAAIKSAAHFQPKLFNDNTKKITEQLINYSHFIDKHNTIMNETDRTMVALLWHENIVDLIGGASPLFGGDKNANCVTITTCAAAIPVYLRILNNICFSDYIDRITFQNQIWQFNEMTSLIKTFHNNKIYHDTFPQNCGKFAEIVRGGAGVGAQPPEIRFTKVLTKYSTEYNNILFIYNLCQKLDMDQKDVLAFFQALRKTLSVPSIAAAENGVSEKRAPTDTEIFIKIEKIFENYDINKLYIKRIYRFLDKNVKKETIVTDEDLDDEESDVDNDD
jgi:GTPase SAR1 family protein